MNRVLIKGGVGPPRLELVQFVRPDNFRQYSLYIQALQILFDRAGDDPRSYFQIAGIHGFPPGEAWNDAPPPNANQGYCHHGLTTFATWHRPYVALLEQEIQNIARDLAETYPVADRFLWQIAAHTLRQPYWGWDQLATVIPPNEIIATNPVEIIGPNGPLNVQNPFLAYQFQAGQNDSFGQSPALAHFAVWTATARNPDNNGVTNVAALQAALGNTAAQIVEQSGELTFLNEWADFIQGDQWTGLEEIHGLIHVLVGGTVGAFSGHMFYVPSAAFDPIFWAHHAQVDRVIDLWHADHPDQWEANDGNLLPFWNGVGADDFWTSPEVSETQTLNYSYFPAELGDPGGANAGGGNAGADGGNAGVGGGNAGAGGGNAGASGGNAGAGDNAGDAGGVETDTVLTTHNWSARISCKKFELGGSFSVFVFLGPVPSDPKDWMTDPTFAGIFAVFANAVPEECPNCISQADLVVKGFVPLNRTILKLSKRSTLEPNFVVDYLKQRINWAIIQNGRVVPINELTSLEVIVREIPLEHTKGRKYEHPGKPSYYPEIGRRKPGGPHEN